MTSGLLINYAGPPHEMSSLFPDNGLAVLAAVMQDAGHEVKINDYSSTTTIQSIYNRDIRKALGKLAPKVFGDTLLDNNEIEQLKKIENKIQSQENLFLNKTIQDLHTYITKNNTSWIGFKLWMGTIGQSMVIARALKIEHQNLKIFCGGPSIDIFKSAILKKYPFIDALVKTEGELALPLLAGWAGGKETLSQIPNLIYHNGHQTRENPIERITDLDTLPFPTYDPDIYPAMSSYQKMKILCFDDSRGCPKGCAFCPGNAKYGKNRIEKSVSRCIEELSFLKKTYDVSYFRFSGSNSSVKLLSGIADGIIENNLDLTFAVFSSAEGLTEPIVEKLSRAGLYSLFVGIESANPHQLKNHLGKPQSVKKLKNVFELLKKHNLFISTSMIYPAPFSNEAIFNDNVKFLTDCFEGYDNCSVALYPAGLYPYTEWFDNPEAYGFSLNSLTKDEYIESVLHYGYNIVLPRYLWDDLPYTLNDKPFKHLLFETNQLAVYLKSKNILPYLVEANLMMADLCGYNNYKEFAGVSNHAFFCGDSERIEKWNAEVNNKQAC